MIVELLNPFLGSIPFSKSISLKVNVIGQMDCDFSYYDIPVQYINYDAMERNYVKCICLFKGEGLVSGGGSR